MANNGMIYASESNSNLPKQKVNRRKLSTNSKGIFQQFLQQTDEV